MQYLALSEIDSENISEVLNNILSKRKHQTTHYCCSDRLSLPSIYAVWIFLLKNPLILLA